LSWIYGYIDRHIAAARPKLRSHLHSFESQYINIYAGGSGKNLEVFTHPQRPIEKVFILGEPILRKDEDFCYPDFRDWQRLFQDEEKLRSLDGHYLILIAGKDGIRAYNDPLCKRSLYVHSSEEQYFICSDISLLKEAGLAELELDHFGAYWHTLFPPHLRRYAPTAHSYYRDVELLHQGGALAMTQASYSITNHSYTPSGEQLNLHKLLENITILPLKAGRTVSVGISGGMDIRPLLAILIGSGLAFNTVHFGSDQTADFTIAKAIAKDNKLPFRFIPEEDTSPSWEQACAYLATRGFGFNPAASCLMAYYPILAEQSEGFLGGYYGELFRFRFMAAHALSILKLQKPNYHSFARYLYNAAESFFVPDVNKALYHGFVNDLKESLNQMPTQNMPNPLWMNLFYVRYSPRTINMPDLSQLDQYINDHMPYLQSSIIDQHWHYGLLKQYNEALHRDIIDKHAPQLKRYPLALGDVSAPYRYRPYALKLKVLADSRLNKKQRPNRNEIFLERYRSQIMALGSDRRTRHDPWLEQKQVQNLFDRYTKGDPSSHNAMLSIIAYILGK
jgi:hypothetical protein